MIRKFTTKNPFTVLGIAKNSSKEDIKKKYYQLAKIYHPDVNPANTKIFQEINQAYSTLMNNGFAAPMNEFQEEVDKNEEKIRKNEEKMRKMEELRKNEEKFEKNQHANEKFDEEEEK